MAGAVWVIPAYAQSGESVSAEMRLQRMLKCNDISDQLAQASCYDDEARQTLTANSVPRFEQSAENEPVDTPAPRSRTEPVEER